MLDGEDENSAERFDVPLNISDNTLLMGLVLSDIVNAGRPRRVKDTNLVRRLYLLTSLKILALTNVPPTLIIS